MRQTLGIFFGTKFVVKYWHAKHKIESVVHNMELTAFSAGLAFSAVTIAVSEHFLLPTAENWSPGWRTILAPGS